LPLSSEARADQGCRKRRYQVPDWSEITCRFPPKSPAAFDRNQVPVCSDFCTQLKALLAPYPSEDMICWPVSARVGNVKNNDPSLIEPIAGVV
jgi:hypothetical protein